MALDQFQRSHALLPLGDIMRLRSGRRAARALRPRVTRVRAVLCKKNCAKRGEPAGDPVPRELRPHNIRGV